MSKWFDKEMKRLMKKFDEMFKKMMVPPNKQGLKSEENSKKFEKKEPGFRIKVEVFNLSRELKKPGRETLSEPLENKESGVVEDEKDEDEPEELALERFKEKTKEDEE